MSFCSEIFENAKIGDVMRSGDAGSGQKGRVLGVRFELDVQEFIGLNGGIGVSASWPGFSRRTGTRRNCSHQER